MSAVDDYLRQLQGLLHVRGPMRRRVLGECGDHLRDASAQYGPNESVRRFGPAQEIAASVNTEVAARRAQRATAATAVGVLAVGASTLSLLHASGDGATAPVGWAVLFFAAAQVAALCTVLGVLQAIACRRQPSTAQEVALLCRRNGCALLAAGITMVAAGVLAALGVLSARLIIRGHPAARQPLVCSPVHDLATLSGIPLPGLRPTRLLLLTVAVAAAAAFLWDHQDHGTPASALTTASIQAALVVLGFLILGPALGLRQSHRRT
jgi:hypothetical protein